VSIIPAVLLMTNYSRNDRSRDNFADRHARLLLQQLDPDAVLFVYGDSDTGPVGYLHVIDGVRPDVTVYNMQGLVFRNRLLPALSSPLRRSERLGAFIASTGKPVYHMTEQVLPPAYGEEHFGFIKRLLPGKPPGAPVARTAEASEQFFRDLVHMPEPRDRWERYTRNQLLHQFGNYLSAAEIGSDASLRERLKPLIESAEGNYFCLNGMVEILTQFGPDRPAWERAVRYLDRAALLRDETLDHERLARERYLRGFLAFRLGDRAGAERAFRDSLEIFPGPANASVSALAQLRQREQSR
jgi:tetratricopeptide (TPR) repeat protein